MSLYAPVMDVDTAPRGLRGITRDAVRTRIADVAVDLFDEHGFDEVTVEQIAGAVGISARSFHRYFPAKEDAVLGDVARWGEVVRESFGARPDDEPVWVSLRTTYEALLESSVNSAQRDKRIMRVLGSTASLRARNLEKHLLWARMLSPLVARRLTGSDALLRAEALVHASLGCFDLAMTTWADPTETRTPVELLRTSFAALTQDCGPTQSAQA